MDRRTIKKVDILATVLAVWTALGVFYQARELVHKGRAREYAALAGRPLEARRAIVSGGVYDFIAFAEENMPARERVKIVGLGADSIECRRAVYYLYPHIVGDSARYVLVFGASLPPSPAYEVVSGLDEQRYIVKEGKG